MIIFDNFCNFWQFLTVFNTFWQFLTMFTFLSTFLDIFWQCFTFWQFLTIFDNVDNWKDSPEDLWHLRYWLQFWHLRNWIHDNLCYLTINCDTGQHSQFLRCFLSDVFSSFLFTNLFSFLSLGFYWFRFLDWRFTWQR